MRQQDTGQHLPFNAFKICQRTLLILYRVIYIILRRSPIKNAHSTIGLLVPFEGVVLTPVLDLILR